VKLIILIICIYYLSTYIIVLKKLVLVLKKCKPFSDEVFKVPKFKYNSRGEGRYLIVTVIILFLSDAPCPRCRSRLKPKIDVEGKIKVVKFLVSINARRVHISAYVAFAAYVSVGKILSFRWYSSRKFIGDYFFPGVKQSPCRSFFRKYRHRTRIYLLLLKLMLSKKTITRVYIYSNLRYFDKSI